MVFFVIFQLMKRTVLFILLFLSVTERLFAFDISGLQPLAPNGIFSTFSAESLQKNKTSVEIGAEKSAEPNFSRFSVRAAYGLSDNVELDLTIPYVYHYSGDRNGLEDVALGFKHRFYDEEKYGPSLAYLLSASIPSGADALTSDGRLEAGLIVSKRIGPFSGHMNLFYVKPGTAHMNDEIHFLGGIEFSAAHNFKILSEILVKKNHEKNKENQIEGRFGYRIKTTDYIYTTFGGGLDMKARSPEYRLFFSVNFTTPKEKTKIKKFIEEE
jgi:hypothetical protein